MKNSSEYTAVFQALGSSFTFDADNFQTIETFVSKLYGVNSNNVDEARYIKFCSKNGVPEPQKLPPTRDALLLHCKRSNYVTAVVKRALENDANIPSLNNYGWVIEDDELKIKWMLLPPAPPQVLNFVACGCNKTSCKTKACVCLSHGLKCTDLCSCCGESCENQAKESENVIIESDSESESDISDSDF